jgi:hypothetical protein
VQVPGLGHSLQAKHIQLIIRTQAIVNYILQKSDVIKPEVQYVYQYGHNGTYH